MKFDVPPYPLEFNNVYVDLSNVPADTLNTLASMCEYTHTIQRRLDDRHRTYMRRVRVGDTTSLQISGLLWIKEVCLPQELIETWVSGIMLNLPDETILQMLKAKAQEVGVRIYDQEGNEVTINE